MKRALLRTSLALAVVLLIGMAGGFFLTTQAGLQMLVWLSNTLLDGKVHIASASGSLAGSPQLNGLRVSDGIDTVMIKELQVQWQPQLLLQRQLAIDAIHCTGVTVQLGPGSPGNYEPEPVAAPLPILVRRLTVENLSIVDEQEEVVTAARGEARQITWQRHEIKMEALDFATSAFTIQAQGTLQTSQGYPLDLSLDFTAKPEGYAPLAATAAVKGPVNALTCEVAGTAPLSAKLTGVLENLLGETSWKAKLSSEEGRLNLVRPGWPEQPFTALVVDGQGTFAQYTLKGTAQVAAKNNQGQVDLSVQMEGDGHGVRVEQLQLGQGRASFKAQGELSWDPVLSWQGEVSGANLDPSMMFPDWPGDLGCALRAKGSWQDGSLAVEAVLDHLQGRLRGYPISGKGEAAFKDNQLWVPAFSVQSGRSSLTMKGSAADAVDLTVIINSPDLAELWPRGRGSLTAKASLSGAPAAPQLDGEAKGSNLAIQDASIKHLTAQVQGRMTQDGAFKALVQAEHMASAGRTLDRVQLAIQGTPARHTVTVEGGSTDFFTSFQLNGGLANRVWQGTLDQLRARVSQAGEWRQGKGAALSLAVEKAGLESLCLTSSEAASLCLSGSWTRPEQQWRLQGAMSALPAGQVAKMFGQAVALEGTLDAETNLQGAGARLVQGRLTASAANLKAHVTGADGAEQILQWRRNTLTVEYAQERLQAQLESELTDGSTLAATLAGSQLPLPASNLRQTPLTGSLRLTLNTLAPLTALCQQTVRFSGQLQGHFGFAGTVVAPHLAGTLYLANGQAEVPQLGLALKPLTVAVSGTAEALNLQATAQSGPGTLRAESRIALGQAAAKGWAVKITGDRFQAVALQGLEVQVSPDLNLVLSPKSGTIRGTVTIPEATITSVDLGSTVAPSDDVLVVDDEQAGQALASWPLFASVKLVAGDKVRVDTHGLAGRISGSVLVTAQPGRPAVGQGTLRVADGTFTTYGRKLTIDVGQLFFTGGPLTNPGVELRSEKRKDSSTVGLLVEGSLRRPELEFYSTPQMEQPVIITQLLEGEALGGSSRSDVGFIGKAAAKTGLGGVVPYLQGVKELTMIDDIKLDSDKGYDSLSLVFGSWLTPKFYVSYGKNLMKESGSFHTSYTLGKGFFLKTETGPSQSGGDIKYEFER